MKKLKKFFKDNLKVTIVFVLGIVLPPTTVFAATILFASSEVSYDNSGGCLNFTNVQDAIDEINTNIQSCGEDAIYRFGESTWTINQDISSLTLGTDYVKNKSQLTNMHSDAGHEFLKYHTNNNVVTDKYVCFIVSEAIAEDNPGMTPGEYCLKGGDNGASFVNNAKIMYNAFGSNYCDSNPYTTTPSSAFGCYATGVDANLTSSGLAYTTAGYWGCGVHTNGHSYCD